MMGQQENYWKNSKLNGLSFFFFFWFFCFLKLLKLKSMSLFEDFAMLSHYYPKYANNVSLQKDEFDHV